MRLLENIKKGWFLFFFFLGTCYALYGSLFDQDVPELSGVVEERETVACTLETILDGSYQSYIDNLWNEIFPGRDRLMRLRNQILYTVCSESPNSNVVIGREKYLFTPTYIGYETQILSPASEEYFQQLGEKLEKLGEMLEANGKEMYIFITPSKAHFCYDKIPMLYKMVEKLEGRVESNYDKLVWELNKRDLHYFDAISYWTVKSFNKKNNPFIEIYVTFKLPHLRKVQTI